MKPYEITYLIDSSLTAEEAESFHEDIKKTVKENKGVPGSEQKPTRKTLAYPINKKTEGYLASVDFEAGAKEVTEIRKKVEKEKNILRYLIIEKQIAKKEEKERPSKKKTLKPEKAKLKEIDDKINEIL